VRDAGLLAGVLHFRPTESLSRSVDVSSSLPLDFSTLDLLPVAVMLCDRDGFLLKYNPRASELWGRMPAVGSPDERFSGAHRLLTPAGDPLPREQSPLADTLRTGKLIRDRDVVFERPDGSRLTVAVTAIPLFDDDGSVGGALGVLHEVSARRRAEDRERLLLQASALLGASLDHQAILRQLSRVPIPHYADWSVIYATDDEGQLQGMAGAHVSPEREPLLRELLRYPEAFADLVTSVVESGNSVIRALLPPPEPDSQAAPHAEVLAALNPESVMAAALQARGKVFGVVVFVLSGSNRRYEPDDLALAEGIARRAALAIDNARLYHESQQANRLKDEFLATLSHELRTPLNAVLGWTQLLLTRQLGPSEADRALWTIRRNAEAQARLIGDILDVSRIITGKLRLNVSPVDLPAVIEAAVESIKPAAEARQIHLTVDDGLSQHFAMLGDPDRLQQVVWNLLSNAVKFTPPGGRVDLVVRSDGESVDLAVRDTGAGIRPEFLPSLFERFRQADSSTTRIHGGLGLGLAIVRHLVELHGGTVRGESAGEGQGAAFTVSLPLHLPVAWGPPEATSVERSQQARPRLRALAGISILVVDDDGDSRRLARKVLEAGGAKVRDATSVNEALAAVERDWPAVLVADIGLPGRDGYDLIRQIRALEAERGHHTPVAALTAYAADNDRRRALSAGFDVYLSKPVDPEVLVSAVARLVGRQ
jgi:signal transduction histidine kinase/CheY-like chemotaxis protein